MNQNSIKVIEKPTAKQVLEFERALRGERLEMFQEAFDVLHDGKQADNDPAIKWRLDNIPYLFRGFKRVDSETNLKHTRPAGVLHINVNKGDVKHELGLASVNVVTTVGVNFIIDAIIPGSGLNITDLKWHGSGTGNDPENIGNLALQMQVDNREQGSQVKQTGPDRYRSVRTLAYTLGHSIVEHGLFWASSGNTLFDRSVFTPIAVDASTSIEFTYEWTLNAGG